ncbi:HAD family hydrolase [Nitratireductor luteus]|uniref:HAD family hydrolase n=1 Tax=Nitratireductor luteus TaxID=2976980 RepID=UPI00223F1BE7|nr:HAD family hydrolase [Nitratireductor luteus]
MRPSTNIVAPHGKVRLIALDMDRTALTNDYRVLPDVADAVAHALNDGVMVVPSTARSPQALRPYADRLGISGVCVCFNGAWTGKLCGQGAVHCQTMNPQSAIRVVTAAGMAGFNPVWFTTEGSFALSDGPLVDREALATGIRPRIAAGGVSDDGPVMKILCLDPRGGSEMDDLIRCFSGEFQFAFSDCHLLEINAHGVSKQTAIARLCNQLQISAEEVCAIGDSENDLQLLNWAGTAIAMGNATPALKEIADWVSTTNEDAGAAAAIRRVLARDSDYAHQEPTA